MAKLTRAQILDAVDLNTEDVTVPEWGGDVTVSELSAAALMELTDALKGAQSSFRERFVAACVLDPETGDRMFTDADVVALGGKSRKALERVWNVAVKLNAFSDEAVEESVKN